MRTMKTKSKLGNGFQVTALAIGALLLSRGVQAAVPGIKGPNFSLDASAMRITQPNGKSVYGWGYGCSGTTAPTSRSTAATNPRHPGDAPPCDAATPWR